MSDIVQISFDVVALVAFLVFTGLCLTLAKSLKGSALKRGFSLASLAGFTHIIGNILTVLGDLVGSSLPLLAFSLIQALFAILLALAVQSFFPTWYKAFKNTSGKPALTGLS